MPSSQEMDWACSTAPTARTGLELAAVWFYHPQWLRQIRRRIGTEVTIRLVLAVVISRLDCCNSVLAGVPLAMLAPLQRIQNAAACPVFELTPRDHITPSLWQLGAICWHIEYKLCCIMLSVHTGRCPAYLKNTVQLTAARQSRSPIDFRGSRPSSVSVRSHTLVRPRGTHCPPTDVPSPNSFRKLLKTHFFILAFNVH